MVHDTVLYDRLEIKPDVDESEIKKAYRKLSFKWHPDKNPNDKEKATKMFQDISEAFTILSDSDKRAAYDRDGYDSLKNPGGMPSNFNPMDIFSQFFGNSGGFGGFGGFNGFGGFEQPQQQVQMEHCMVEKEVTLEDLYCQRSVTISFKQKSYCKKCDGNGTKDGTKSSCKGCNGSGRKIQVIKNGNMIQQMIGACNECNGSGEGINKQNVCDECSGKKFIIKDKSIDIPLSRNLTNGNKMVIEGKGHIFKTNKTNVIVVIREKPHPVFKRNGKDLHINVRLRLFQTLYGFTKTVQHLDGRILTIKYHPLKKMDTMLKIKNEGMGGFLIVHLNTSIPNLEKLEDNERNLLKKILIKTNMTEYNKEVTIGKSPTNIIPLCNIEEHEPDEEADENDTNTGQEIPPGVQCAQQ
jgi:DnaJ-class molecular chaperone